MFIKTVPIAPNIIGENLDAEPINGVRFIPIQDKTKSAAANIRSKVPSTCTTEKLFSVFWYLFYSFFFLLLLLFVMSHI